MDVLIEQGEMARSISWNSGSPSRYECKPYLYYSHPPNHLTMNIESIYIVR